MAKKDQVPLGFQFHDQKDGGEEKKGKVRGEDNGKATASSATCLVPDLEQSGAAWACRRREPGAGAGSRLRAQGRVQAQGAGCQRRAGCRRVQGAGRWHALP